MSASAEHIFLLLKEKKYEEVTPLIKQDENLVNAIHPNYSSSLLQILIKTKATDQSNALLYFVLTHPKLDFSYECPVGAVTNLDEMITFLNLELFQAVIKSPKIIFNRDKLTYESAKEYAVLIENSHRKNVQKDPDSVASNRSKARLANQEQIIALLRDATILHAIRTDDAHIMDLLEQSGAKPSDRLGALGNGKLPSHLLTSENINLKAWFKSRFEKLTTSMANNPHSFHNKDKEVERLETQLAELEIKHLGDRTVANKNIIQSEVMIGDQVISTLR